MQHPDFEGLDGLGVDSTYCFGYWDMTFEEATGLFIGFLAHQRVHGSGLSEEEAGIQRMSFQHCVGSDLAMDTAITEDLLHAAESQVILMDADELAGAAALARFPRGWGEGQARG